ncbi:unnamed protein product [Sphagnum jensenii]|uniref:Uncharacterized protein n=1 Tax=Sphagnum jensenii TaxID=128206 RepID=A0ABP1BIN5_9BRYO
MTQHITGARPDEVVHQGRCRHVAVPCQIMRASAPTAGTCLDMVLFKFVTSEDRQVTLRGCKGMVGTKPGLDEDLTLAQQACKSKLWPLFKKAKVAGKCTFWRAAELFIDDTHICPPSFV